MADNPKPPPERRVIVLTATRDPLAEKDEEGRDVDYRLKLALKLIGRAFGFKCVEVRDAKENE